MNTFLVQNFQHIRSLAQEMENIVSTAGSTTGTLQNELAGMFAVTIVATYESIVRDTLIAFAGCHHPKFEKYIENEFSRMNSRIAIDDLYRYSRSFGLAGWTDPGTGRRSTIFHRLLNEQQSRIENRLRKDMKKCCKNLFDWRNDYAHNRTSKPTLGDICGSRRAAKYVIKAFSDAFEESQPDGCGQ
ncbi:MAG: HEPN domain-containing protein [Rhodobacteraceae bacterium]|nr:HEPN domain-containing protein [Paracoccaceae bacterium]